MKIGIVGTGYQADAYLATFALHPELEIAGAWDIRPERLRAFCDFHRIKAYASYDELLADDEVQLVLNVTNPRSHWEVSGRALAAGKHVYSEKPLAMSMEEAYDLADRAEKAGVVLTGAPCNQLGEHVTELRTALADRASELGRPLVVHAEMDDGMIPGLDPEAWSSASGASWPVQDEYEVGCTLEHAGYQIGPLVSLFGPVRAVTAFNASLLPEKLAPYDSTVSSPDLSVGLLEFDGGLVARLTCSILAPIDRSLRVVCERGVLTLSDIWEYDTPLRYSPTGLTRAARLHRRFERTFAHRAAPGFLLGRRVRNTEVDRARRSTGLGKLGLAHQMDFARGIAQMVAQISGQGPELLTADLALHVTEVALALSSPTAMAGRVEMTTADRLRPA